ncbi:LytR/AlgR family response regulator transcription factor [Prevotella communis]|uniref:LytR/AlgR family response regulator transcription factor n=1 Tax=Prevotella communis TaxID=2913614 RepID=UPI001EDA844F|nr:LytTR family DNA-binding domain-containing protein [Prevotella communis]UKK57472.1 LytTR family DNA-binding domain-containing protein [Prevotella communis]UKK69732.1 LytTR family DNA-binding domain-containing protein [Prevotella communis]
MIKVLAIDDEPLALQQLVTYINKVPFLELAGQCHSALEAQKLMEEEMVDAIFCDINMPDLSGMDFVRQLAAPPFIVFTTAYSEYAVEGYKVNAVDYLLKPFGMNDFLRAALKVQEQYNLRHQETPQKQSSPVQADGTIFVKTDYRVVRIAISDIRYIEGMSEYLKIHLEGQKPIITLLSMKKMEDYLPPTLFMRIHRSYIVNLQKIQEVNKNRVILDADTYLPIGDLYKDRFNEYLEQKFLGK